MPARRWLKRVRWTGGGLAAITLVLFALLAYVPGQSGESMCGNQELASVMSPDGRRRALVFERDCGATAGFSTQIAILGPWERLGEAPGAFFVADTNHGAAPSGPGGGPEVRVSWLDNTHVEIRHHPKARIFSASRREGDLEIRYRAIDPP